MHMYSYSSINLGPATVISTSFIGRDHGHWISFFILIIVLAIVPIIPPVYKRHYIKTPPRGSIILEVRYPLTFRLFLPSRSPPFLLQCVWVFMITASIKFSANPIAAW